MFLVLNAQLEAQETAGLVHSNYAGTNVLWFNPAGMHHQKDWLSIHIITGDLFFSNNYAYLAKEDFSIPKAISGNVELPMHQTGYSQGERPFYIYNKGLNTRLDGQIKIQGPAAMFIYNQHAFGLFSGGRAVFHTRNITPELGNLIYYGFGYDPQQNHTYTVNNFNTSMLGWGEVGLSYAYQWNRRLFSNWNFGISIKKLYGAAGYYLHIDNVAYNILNDTTLAIENMNASLGYSMPINYETDEFPYGSFINGKGWSFDIGVEYQQLLDRQAKYTPTTACGQKHYNYKYRFGISLMDFGWVKFDNNAQLHEYNDISYTWENIDTTKYHNWNQLIQEVSTRFYGDPNASLKKREFRMWLPASLNASFDYNFENNIFLNGSLVYNFPFSGSFVRKASIFSLTPRYERRFFEFSMPLSLYQWRYPRIGVAMRIAYFTIGSDYFTSLLGVHDFNGMDIYFSIKINLAKGSCEKRNKINPCGDAFQKFPWSK